MLANKQSKQVAGAQVFMFRCNDPREPFLACDSMMMIEERQRLYFGAGAKEVWLCGHTGRMLFFLHAAPEQSVKASILCPDMPLKLQ